MVLNLKIEKKENLGTRCIFSVLNELRAVVPCSMGQRIIQEYGYLGEEKVIAYVSDEEKFSLRNYDMRMPTAALPIYKIVISRS